MCGIFGVGLLAGHSANLRDIEQIVSTLFINSMMRGLDAAGIALVSQSSIHILKDKGQASELLASKEYADFIKLYFTNKTLHIMGHTRSETKGSHKDNVNNHPIVAGDFVGIHNGKISNDEELFKKLEARGYAFRSGQVDSEIIFRMLDYGKKYEKCSTINSIITSSLALIGGFAVACTERETPHILYLFKNTPPIALHKFHDSGVIIYASLDSYIDEAVKGRGLGVPIKETIGVDSGVAIDLLRNTISRFIIGSRMLQGV